MVTKEEEVYEQIQKWIGNLPIDKKMKIAEFEKVIEEIILIDEICGRAALALVGARYAAKD